MDVRPIHDDADHDWTIAQIAALMQDEPAPGTPDGNRPEVLLAIIGAYEQPTYPIPTSSQADLVRFVMEQSGRTQPTLRACSPRPPGPPNSWPASAP